MTRRTLDTDQAWKLLVFAAAIAHVLIGMTFLLPGTKLGGPYFDSIDAIPNLVWGVWAVASGALIFVARIKLYALFVTALWYALWGACLFEGVIESHGPFYAIPLYVLVILIHLVFAVVEWFERKA